MNKKLFGTVFTAAVMLAGTLETYGGETMKSELLTVRETAIVAPGVWPVGAIKRTKYPEQAYLLGKNV